MESTAALEKIVRKDSLRASEPTAARYKCLKVKEMVKQLSDSRNSFRMQVLEHPDRDLSSLQRSNSLSRSTCGSNRRKGWNAMCYSCAANGLLVKPGILSLRSIDYELNPLPLD